MTSFYVDGPDPQLAAGVAEARAWAARAERWATATPDPVEESNYSAKKYATDAAAFQANAAQSAAEAQASAAAIQSLGLNGLANVDISGAVPGEVLKFTGLNWVNGEDASPEPRQLAVAAFSLSGVTGGLLGARFGIEASVRYESGGYELKLTEDFGGDVDSLQMGYSSNNLLGGSVVALDEPVINSAGDRWIRLFVFGLLRELQDAGRIHCVVFHAGAT